MKFIYLLSCLFFSVNILFAQTDKEIARQKAMDAIKMMDNGQVDESIALLEEAKKLDPKDVNIPYEIAYANYLKKEYGKSIEILEGIKKHKDANDRVHQLLGNSYSMSGDPDKAIAAYEAGLKKFPKSGILYLERGNIEAMAKRYEKALNYYEKGILVDPKFPSNYYRATIIYLNSSEEIWGMIYGEIFMNLERNTKRTADISKMLYDTYKSEIKIESDTSASANFCQTMFLNADKLKKNKDIKLPFCMIYGPTLILSAMSTNEININTLNDIRTRFIDFYYQMGHHKNYPNILFEYQDKIKKAGHLEAYNYWILMKGDEEAFGEWHEQNEQKWEAFVKWFTDNQLKTDDKNKFHSDQYF